MEESEQMRIDRIKDEEREKAELRNRRSRVEELKEAFPALNRKQRRNLKRMQKNEN